MTSDDDVEDTGVVRLEQEELEPNTRTVIGEPAPARPRAVVSLRKVFIAAHDGLRALADRPDAAVVVAAVTASGRVVGQAAVAAGSALIVGRHTQCGIHLASHDVSLRHLAAHVCVEDGSPVTRLWDQ